MNRVRVGLDVTPLLGPPTGVHQVTRGLADALGARDDIDLRGWLLTGRGDRPEVDFPVRRSRLPASVAIAGWSRSRFPPGRLLTGPVDVVHGTNFLAPPSARSIISLQDLTPITRPAWCRPEVAAMAGPLRHAVRRGATIHVSSALVREEAIDVLDIEPDRVRLVHHGIRPVVGGDPATGRTLAGAPRYVLVLGTVEHRKNVPAAVQGMESLPADVRLVIAGPSGNAEADVTAAVAKLGGSRVVRLRTVDEPTRNSLLRGATVLAWPSRYEGFSVPPLEALSVGTPIVATAVGALPELIGDRIPLVPSGDDDAFGAALTEALASPPPVPPEIAEVITGLTWARAGATMTEVYQAVATSAGR
jgi:glycosyltransferase involved in cell wall biosynthesis